jgi:hypothetical protein
MLLIFSEFSRMKKKNQVLDLVLFVAVFIVVSVFSFSFS